VVVASLEVFGLRACPEIIKTPDGETIDGHLRVEAMRRLGLDPDLLGVRVCTHEEAATEALVANVMRRHLSKSQRTLLALGFESEHPKSSELLGAMLHPEDRGCNAAPLARLFGVSKRLIQMGRRLLSLDPPEEVLAEVREGHLTITGALKRLTQAETLQDVHTNVRWERPTHALLKGLAVRCRSSQADALNALVDMLGEREDLQEALYQRLNPGCNAAPTSSSPVPGAGAGEHRAGTDSVLYAHAPESLEVPSRVLEINTFFLPDSSTENPPHARGSARGAEQANERAEEERQEVALDASGPDLADARGSDHEGNEGEGGWSLEALVDAYNDVCAEWRGLHPEVDPEKRIHPILALGGTDRTASIILERAFKGDLAMCINHLRGLLDVSPQVIAAHRRHTLRMLATATRTHPRRGPWLLQVDRWRGLEVPRASEEAPSEPATRSREPGGLVLPGAPEGVAWGYRREERPDVEDAPVRRLERADGRKSRDIGGLLAVIGRSVRKS
jgi:ParB-like chromosome segregation protein Spo0J